MSSAKLYVGNLSLNTTEASLRSAFALEGDTVLAVTIAVDAATGRPRGFGFVEMASAPDCVRAVASWNGRELDGHAIIVSDARDRSARSAPAGSEFSKDGHRRH